MSMPAENTIAAPTLADLLRGFADAPAVAVRGIASDSRRLQPGFLFLAVAGATHHGLDFLDAARKVGVAAVAWDASTGEAPGDIGVPTIAVDELAGKLGAIADRFYGSPSDRLEVVGITGTNGKTTVAWMIAQVAGLLGEKCAYLGTLGHGVGEVRGAGDMTTPPAVELHGRLAEFVDAGAKHAAVEVSSHALAQGRVDGVRFDTAIFTNLTRDHLDYHADMREYFETKARLFLDHDPAIHIVNADSEYGEELAADCGPETVTVSTNVEHIPNGRPYLFVRSVAATERGSDVGFISSWGDGAFALPLPGDFNIANAVLALAWMLRKGVPVDTACDLMSQVQAPPGRMQRVGAAGPAVFVDYAHTPVALDSALGALRAHCRGRLWCVFGCGGDRDAGKRPQMGETAERCSDHVVITSDNPRSEDAGAIIDDIVAGLAQPEDAAIVEDRAAAIAWAVGQADAGDTVLIAGKGHEDYQEANGERTPFSDRAVASLALDARGRRA